MKGKDKKREGKNLRGSFRNRRDMPRLDLTPVIAVRAADRDRYSNPGQ